MRCDQGRRPDKVGTCPWLPYAAPSALVECSGAAQFPFSVRHYLQELAETEYSLECGTCFLECGDLSPLWPRVAFTQLQ